MSPLLLTLLLGLLGLLLVARWFVVSQPATILRTAKWTAALLLVGGGLLLLLTGRLAWLMAAVAASLPWIARGYYLHNIVKSMRGAWNSARGTARPAAGGQRSEVNSRFLAMSLDHDTGALSGTVLEGPLRGRSLDDLGVAELQALLRECQADPQSSQLLEAWLDRTHPEWREAPPDAPQAPGGMSRAEAFEVLGLDVGASQDDVREAYRRLMVKLHPDHGGSSYLAAKLNQARDLLLNS
ncbi:MAG: DnaJ domain-containing protein [Alphaproteobacteria bacterium]|nr:DnaJ domain-containing protein [Alphaproteobacteria bacterium]